ncbi:hypothetical protein [Nocardioides sp.]|uniref:hypothetical protein n=1 Tax=Nocardioides sp. TaxID=35761 RepID=UPI002734A295|nr:hypothetical protein [Nocardioides sp.]MDP3893955.1 hypothetical protein [Nocardioides sp.]
MAHSSHKRDANARRTPKTALIAAPIAGLVTLGTVGFGVVNATPVTGGMDLFAAQGSVAAILGEREPVVSRSSPRTSAAEETAAEETAAEKRAERRAKKQARAKKRARQQERREAARQATRRAVRNADTKQWTTAELNLWAAATDDAEQQGVLESGKQVLVTGRSGNGRVEIVLGDKPFWVTEGHLADEKPVSGPSSAPCANGASATGGANVQKVLRATCAFAPEITSYGGIRGGGGDHARGKALDVMVSGPRGWEIANFLRDNYRSLGISYIIYAQKIWSVDRSGEGWRGMSSRGSTTANHYDHVHVSTY